MDVLSRIINEEVVKRRIASYIVNGAQSISHLIYPDDVIIFSKANAKSLAAIKASLEKFSAFLGLEIYTLKSSVVFSKAVTNYYSFQRGLDFPIASLHITYLGILP